MPKMRLRPGPRPEHRWGSSRCFPDPIVGWGEGHPPPKPYPLGAEPPSVPSALVARRLVSSLYSPLFL